MLKTNLENDPSVQGIVGSGDNLRGVQVEALAIVRIIKHCALHHPSIATGSLVGMDVDGILQVTNCFAFSSTDISTEGNTFGVDNSTSAAHAATAAASAPRSKANASYRADMIRHLSLSNIDANNVGWYTSAIMGNFVTQNFVENQFFYQKELNERAIALVLDVNRSWQAPISLKAFRLSPVFMTAYREGKFTIESLHKLNLRYQDILVELPVAVHNSSILSCLMHQLPSPPSTVELDFPASVAALEERRPDLPFMPNFAALNLQIDAYLEKTSDLLLEAVETHQTETNNHHYFHRMSLREQGRIAAWQSKRKQENAARAAAKQPLLPEDEWQRLFKLPVEPSRLDLLLNSWQIEQYARQTDMYTTTISSKLFAVRENLLPGSDRNE